MIKMKIWVHLTDLLKHVKTDTGDQIEIVDIQLSFSKKPKHLLINRMAITQGRIKELNEGISTGQFSAYGMFKATKEMTPLQEKIDRLHIRYDEAVQLELKNGQNPSLVPKKLLTTNLEYIYVTLRRNAEVKKVLSLFVKEPNTSRLIRRLLCITDQIKDSIQFDNQDLVIEPAIEPDQINWMNMELTKSDRQWRLVITIGVVVFFVFFSFIVTIFMGRFSSAFSPASCAGVPKITAQEAYIR